MTQIINDKKILTSFISSFVWGDGALSSLKSTYRKEENGDDFYSGRKNSKYYIKQLSIHEDYINWQAEILENLTKVSIIKNPSYVDNRGYFCKEQLSLSTLRHPFYTNMRNRFYIDGHKVIDPHYLKLWDSRSLACFYMDNGWIEKTQQQNGNIYVRCAIATHAYSYGDVIILKKMIKEKYNIEFDIRKQKQKSGDYKFYLRNSKNNSIKFLDLVSPFIFSSFSYKIDTSVARLAP